MDTHPQQIKGGRGIFDHSKECNYSQDDSTFTMASKQINPTLAQSVTVTTLPGPRITSHVGYFQKSRPPSVRQRSKGVNLLTLALLCCSSSVFFQPSEAATVLVKPSDRFVQKNPSSLGATPTTVEDEFIRPEVSSPLHVAQCRATCLQKFNNRLDGNLPTDVGAEAGLGTAVTDPPDESSSCPSNPDCFMCWKSCERLEPLVSSSNSYGSKGNGKRGKGDDDKVGEASAKKSKSLGTMCSQSQRLCLSGCQVACGFYESLMMRMNEPMSRPVVATKRENVLHISSGKIEWPQEPRGKNDMKLADLLNPHSLVYVLIQQYPDLKWRQIIQTTDTSVEISKSLSTQMANKLRNVRVLVVSPNGLVTIYYPETQQQQQVEIPSSYPTKEERQDEIIDETTSGPPSGISVDGGAGVVVDPASPIVDELPNPSSPIEDGAPTVVEHENNDPAKQVGDDFGENLWELRRVSLIHQKSLVIAELCWNPVKYSEDQEYLITWELDGGGLKGHLVTDSTTVSLSLWPDTLYHIQVELFERELEDGEQDEEAEDDSLKPKSKSFPLTVDTSEASYPMLEKPSALSNSEQESAGHKSVSEFLNVTLLLTISSAALLVLGSLLLALTWHKATFHRRRCSTKDPQLLQDTDDFSNGDHESSASTQTYDAPTVAIISPAQLVYPSEKVLQEPLNQLHQNHHHQQQQQWFIPSASPPPTSQNHPTSKQIISNKCWWQNLSTNQELKDHYHINNSCSLSRETTSETTPTKMYLPPSNNPINNS